jgi:anthranilate phosphoribosyltransferase
MTPSQKLSRNVLARRDNTMEVWYGMPKQFCPLAQTLTLRQCDIVGTGGDSHNTYNVSTTSSILASALLMMAKHGNNASTSKSGSADLLLAASPAPVIAATTEKTLPDIYSRTNYAFLYAREWHPGMKHAAAVRKELPFRTIFNLLGPLANPVQNLIEARILGVAKRDMGPVFAESMRLTGTKKALIVCGAEDLDELSCAGPSYCWMLRPQSEASDAQVDIVPFTVSPEDFGLKPVPLSLVAGGKLPAENAVILQSILDGTIDPNDPVLTFVLINTAALLVTSGICEAESSDMGSGDDGKVVTERGPGGLRWKEGVRRARWCISSGAAKEQWDAFVKVTGEIGGQA